MQYPAISGSIDLKAPTLFFSIHKSGSSLANILIHKALGSKSIRKCSIPDFYFRRGESWDLPDNHKVLTEFMVRNQNICWHGFREVPSFILDFAQRTTIPPNVIVLIRDPRDCLISQYYSIAYSHVVPKEGELGEVLQKHREITRSKSISQFIEGQLHAYANKRGCILYNLEKLLDTLHIIRASKIRVYKYENMVFRKYEFLKELLIDFFELQETDELLSLVEKVVSDEDRFVVTEQQGSHIRNVLPGDFFRKVDTATANSVSTQMSCILNKAGYAHIYESDFC